LMQDGYSHCYRHRSKRYEKPEDFHEITDMHEHPGYQRELDAHVLNRLNNFRQDICEPESQCPGCRYNGKRRIYQGPLDCLRKVLHLLQVVCNISQASVQAASIFTDPDQSYKYLREYILLEFNGIR